MSKYLQHNLASKELYWNAYGMVYLQNSVGGVSMDLFMSQEEWVGMSPFLTYNFTDFNGLNMPLEGPIGGFINSYSHPTRTQEIGEVKIIFHHAMSSRYEFFINSHFIHHCSQINI